MDMGTLGMGSTIGVGFTNVLTNALTLHNVQVCTKNILRALVQTAGIG